MAGKITPSWLSGRSYFYFRPGIQKDTCEFILKIQRTFLYLRTKLQFIANGDIHLNSSGYEKNMFLSDDPCVGGFSSQRVPHMRKERIFL